MNRDDVIQMINYLKEAFTANAQEETSDWYMNVAQGVASAHNAIVTTEPAMTGDPEAMEMEDVAEMTEESVTDTVTGEE